MKAFAPSSCPRSVFMHSVSFQDNDPIGGLKQALNNVSKTLIVQSQTLINCLQLSDTKSDDDKNDVISEKLLHCIFLLWLNTQNLTG